MALTVSGACTLSKRNTDGTAQIFLRTCDLRLQTSMPNIVSRRDRWKFTTRPMIVGGTTNLGLVHNCTTGLPPDPNNLSGRRLMHSSKHHRKHYTPNRIAHTYLTMLRKLPNETRCNGVAPSGKIKRAEIEHAHALNLRTSASQLD